MPDRGAPATPMSVAPHYEWSPIVSRPRLQWPNDARVAVCVVVSIEHMELQPPAGSVIPPSAVIRGPYPSTFDPTEASHRAYGNRVGVFRVIDILDRHGVPGTAAVDAHVAAGAPRVIEECLRRGWEVVAHGLAFSRMLAESVPPAEEAAYIDASLWAIEAATRARPQGWLGVEYGQSSRTLDLLASRGVRYVCDWPSDEQPVTMSTPHGSVVNLPVAIDLDTVFALRLRRLPVAQWKEMVTRTFDRLWEDGATNPRLLVLNLHPHLIGQPFRAKYLSEALEHVARHDSTWLATGSEIADCFAGHGR